MGMPSTTIRTAQNVAEDVAAIEQAVEVDAVREDAAGAAEIL